jgi:hypothetical protein
MHVRRHAYAKTPIERWLEAALVPIGSSLTEPAYPYEDEGMPPDPDTPILTRSIIGTLSGTYHRFVNAPGPLPLSIAASVARLEGYPGTLEEDIVFASEPSMQILTQYHEGRSLITQVHLDHPEDHDRFGRIVGAYAHLPAAHSIEVLARADPETFIRSLSAFYSGARVPNAYNALS